MTARWSLRAAARFAVTLALGVTVLPAAVRADDEVVSEADSAMAQVLFEAGRGLMRDEKWAEAAAKFAESNRLEPSSGTLVNLGQCQEKLGKTASAWASYKKAIPIARAAGKTGHLEKAEEYIAAIEPKLSRLTIQVKSPVPGMVVRRDGVAIGEAAIGVSAPVDPGTRVVEASAEGYKPWKGEIVVGENAVALVLEVPALVRAPIVPKKQPPPVTTPPATDPGFTQRVLGFTIGSVGLATVTAGAVLGGLVFQEASDAEANEDLCPEKKCTEEGLGAIEKADAMATASNITLAVGGALAVAGIVVVLTAPKPVKASPKTGVEVVPVIEVGSSSGARRGGFTGVAVSGRF